MSTRSALGGKLPKNPAKGSTASGSNATGSGNTEGDQTQLGKENGTETQKDYRFTALLDQVQLRIQYLPTLQESQGKHCRNILYALIHLLSCEKTPMEEGHDPINNPSFDDRRMQDFLECCSLQALLASDVLDDAGIWRLLRSVIVYFDTQTSLTMPEQAFKKLEIRLGEHILRTREALRTEGFTPGDSKKFSEFCAEHFGKPQPPNPTPSVEAKGVPGSTAENVGSLLVTNHGTREQNEARNTENHDPPQDARRDRNSHGNTNDVEDPAIHNSTFADDPRAPKGPGQGSSGAPPPPPGGDDDDSDDDDRDDAGRNNRPPPFGRGGRAPPPRDQGPAHFQGRQVAPSMVVSAFEKHYAGASGEPFAGELTEHPSFPHWVVNFETQLEVHGISEEAMKLLLLKTAVSGMAATFYTSDIRGDLTGRLQPELSANTVPASTLAEAVHRLEERFCSPVMRSALRTDIQGHTLKQLQEDEDLPYMKAVDQLALMIQRYSLNGPDTYKSQQAQVDVFVDALEPEEWTKGLVSRAKAFRHTYSLTKFITELKALAQANARANKDFDLGKPSLRKGKRGLAKVFTAEYEHGGSHDQNGFNDVEFSEPELHEPTAALFLDSAAQSGVYYGEEGPYTVTPDGYAVYYGDTRGAPRFPRRAPHRPPRSQAPRVRPPPTRYPASLPLYQPPRPPSMQGAPRLSAPMQRAPYAPGASALGPCNSCGKHGHLWRQCPQAGRSGLGQLAAPTAPSRRPPAEPFASRYLDEIHHLRAENEALARAHYTAPADTGPVNDTNESTPPATAAEHEEDIAAGREAFHNYLSAATMPRLPRQHFH